MKKIRKGDQVIVTTGKKENKGKIGIVLQLPEGKVVVEGINLAKKHQKPNPMRNIAGGIELKAMPIDISNVAIYNAETKKADRVGIKVETKEIEKDGKVTQKIVRSRVYKSTGANVPDPKWGE